MVSLAVLFCGMYFVPNSISVYVFKPSSSDIVYSKPLISKSPVTCAIFIPQTKGSTKGKQLEWQTSSQLYFFNEEQELQTVVSEEEEEKRSSLDPVSVFTVLAVYIIAL